MPKCIRRNSSRRLFLFGKNTQLTLNMEGFLPALIKRAKSMILISLCGYRAGRSGCFPCSITKSRRNRSGSISQLKVQNLWWVMVTIIKESGISLWPGKVSLLWNLITSFLTVLLQWLFLSYLKLHKIRCIKKLLPKPMNAS